ncbi:MAG: 50S ribosomal protein L32 [SAR86 cluster bacterium]|nr:50S ribosomal protein L32 [SAR86 cluster bacterium]|tara:strand:+ start:5288 stop:5488 length:201 start_codon:yes stop_codon:yes gene_type:complete
MAVQKSKVSKSRKRQRRSHHALKSPTLSTDSITGERHLRHHMTKDGFYKGKQVIELKVEEEAEETP